MEKRGGFAIVVATTLIAFEVAAMAGSGEESIARIVGQPSAALEASLVSSRLAPERGSRPGITAGSGLVLVDDRAFVAQDDSTMLAVIGKSGPAEPIRLVPPIQGADRFLESFGNKKLKPDLEAIFEIAIPRQTAQALGAPATAGEAIVLLGSGSLQRTRDRVVVVFLATPLASSRVVAVDAHGLYDRLRAEPRLTGQGGQLNLEGAVVRDGGRLVRLYNRGNAKDSLTASVDIPADELLRYLAEARNRPETPFRAPLGNFRRYDLGTTRSGFPLAITDATVARTPDGRELVIVSAVAEETTSAIEDGAVSGTTVGLELPDGRLLLAPLRSGSALKIEGIAVRSVESRNGQTRIALAGVVDPDATDPDTPSTLVEILLTYGEGAEARSE